MPHRIFPRIVTYLQSVYIETGRNDAVEWRGSSLNSASKKRSFVPAYIMRSPSAANANWNGSVPIMCVWAQP